MRKYIIQDIDEGLYYGGVLFGWDVTRIMMAKTFDTKEDAEKFARGEPDGCYKIEEIYIVES